MVKHTQAPDTDVRFIVIPGGVDCKARIDRILRDPANPRELLIFVHHQHPQCVTNVSWSLIHLDLEFLRRGGHEFTYYANFQEAGTSPNAYMDLAGFPTHGVRSRNSAAVAGTGMRQALMDRFNSFFTDSYRTGYVQACPRAELSGVFCLGAMRAILKRVGQKGFGGVDVQVAADELAVDATAYRP